MKKRILSLALVLALVVSMLPVGTYAVGSGTGTAHVHCMCGAEKTLDATCAKCGEKAVSWDATDKMPSATGNYYLTQTVSAAPQTFQGQQIAICLHGSNIQSAAGKRIAELKSDTNLTITDCDANNEVGSVTGCNTNTDGTVFRVNEASILNLYNGQITGNHMESSDGIIFIDAGTASGDGGAFYMYGGQISGNTLRRGAVYTEPVQNVKPAVVQILGGEITDNVGKGTGIWKAGAGVYSYFEVIIGGDAQISGNTAAEGVADVYLRNSFNTSAKLVLSSNVPLCNGAKINYGTEVADTAANMTTISGSPTSWSCNWVTYNDTPVSWDASVFKLGHYHNGVEYTAWDTIPSAAITSSQNGHYYLTADVERTSVIAITDNVELTLCLNGHDVTLTSGAARLLGFAGSNSVVTVEDCTGYYDAETKTYVSGALSSHITTQTNGAVVLVGRKNTFVLNGAQISGVTNTAEAGAPVFVSGSDANGVATFRMESGAICGNTAVHGGAIYAAAGVGEGSVVDINGGYLYGNTATAAGGAIYLAGKAQVTIDDAVISDNHAETGAAVYIGANAVVETTATDITGNTAEANGVVYVSVGLNGAAGGTFTMNSGKLSGNTSNRGAVYTAFETDATKTPVDPVVRILGGTITGNTGAGTGGIAGGAGIYAFCPVEIGGNAQIYGNTAAESVDDLYLRNDSTFTGKLIVSKEVPLTQAANIHYGTKTAETVTTGLAYIGAAEGEDQLSDIQANNLTYVNKKLNVYYTQAKGFYLAPAVVGNTSYPTAAAALNASSADAYAKLLADSAETVTAQKDVYVNLNGYDVAAVNMGTYTLYGMDSVTDDYDSYNEENSSREYGVISSVDNAAQIAVKNEVDGKTYVRITEDGTGTSFHKVYLSVYNAFYRTPGNGMGFKARFAADEAVKNSLKEGDTHGIRFTLTGNVNNEAKSGDTYVAAKESFAAGLPNNYPNKLLIAVTDILKRDGSDLANAEARANIKFAGTPYMTLADGTRIEGVTSAAYTLNDMVKKADAKGADLGETARTKIREMLNAYSTYFYGNDYGYPFQYFTQQ